MSEKCLRSPSPAGQGEGGGGSGHAGKQVQKLKSLNVHYLDGSTLMKVRVRKHNTSVFILKHFRLQTKKKKKTEIVNQPGEPRNTGDYFLGQDLRFQPSSNTQSRGEHDK